MKCKIGIGKSSDIESAINEAAADIHNPKFIFLYSEVKKFEKAMKILSSHYPSAIIIGGTGPFIAGEEIVEDNIGLFAIEDGIEISAGVIKDLSKYPLKHIMNIEKTVNKISTGREDTVCFEVCTGNEEILVSTMSSLLSQKNIPLVGGTTQGSDESYNKYVGFNGKVYKDACVYAVIKNLNGKIKVYNESIYKDKQEGLIVTKVNRDSREILEFNKKNAVDVYCDKLGIKRDEISTHNMINPLGRKVGNDIYITAINPDNKNKTLKCYKRVNQNDLLTIMELGDYKKIIKDTVHRIQSDFNHVSAVFSINCIVRYLLFKELNYIHEYSRIMNFSKHNFGIVGDGEQFINQHVNQTMVCIVFE